VIDELQKYQITDSEKAINIFQTDSGTPYVKHLQLVFIYNGCRTTAVDQELHPKDLEVINEIARKLGITDEQIDQTRRVQILFHTKC
jgi:hypothetical protein